MIALVEIETDSSFVCSVEQEELVLGGKGGRGGIRELGLQN
jgi:hypothetical protein